MESVNIVFRGLRGSSVAQNYLDCRAVRAALFVNLPRSALVSGFLPEKWVLNVPLAVTYDPAERF